MTFPILGLSQNGCNTSREEKVSLSRKLRIGGLVFQPLFRFLPVTTHKQTVGCKSPDLTRAILNLKAPNNVRDSNPLIRPDEGEKNK